MKLTPSNAAIIKAAPLMSKVDELSRARGENASLREPMNFAKLVLVAVKMERYPANPPQTELDIAANEQSIRDAIVLAFMLGVCYDES